ncbi:MAG TPA: TonB-dependent receptor, partial [Bacteroidia bacterium]|nr:TonB-dependent receptor [Bacteroidia bacterium]
MTKLLTRTGCCLVIFLFCLQAAAQDQRKLVSANFSNVDITVLTQELERQTGYYFYYDLVVFDSARFNLSVTSETLQHTLETAFQNTDFRFAILESQKQVFLTKGVEIKTELPAGYFTSAVKDTAQSAIPEYGDKKATRPDASIENKLFDVGVKGAAASGSITVVGYVRNIKTGEPVVGASISQANSSNGTSTDQYGYYSIELTRGRHTLIVQGIGMTDTRRQVMVYSNGKLDIDMTERVVSLREVIVSAQKRANVRNVSMGTERLTMRAIKQVPSVFGEADVLKAVLTLPGVKTVGEASTGFNVRGGSADQNLILFNDVTIYNPTHFFGFFSAFNPDLVKDVELYKSSIPSKYGGRLSSVLDVSSREGNKKNFAGTAGIGLLTSRFNIEGPLKKDRTSFILGGRTTYARWLLNLLPDDYKHSKASFYDVNLLISHQVNNKNSLYFTGYLSGDRFNLNSDTSYGYNNSNVSVKWKHIFNN